MDFECTFDAVPHPHAQYPGGNDREGDYNQTHDRFPTNVPHAQTVTVSHFCVRGMVVNASGPGSSMRPFRPTEKLDDAESSDSGKECSRIGVGVRFCR